MIAAGFEPNKNFCFGVEVALPKFPRNRVLNRVEMEESDAKILPQNHGELNFHWEGDEDHDNDGLGFVGGGGVGRWSL